MTHDHDGQDAPPRFWRSRYVIGWVVLGTIAGYFLLTEHLAHVVGALPLLLLLACPLMHIFMHHGHGGHGHADATTDTEPQKPVQPKPGEPS